MTTHSLTPQDWDRIRNRIRADEALPAWAAPAWSLPFPEVAAVQTAASPRGFSLESEKKRLEPDYLDFLKLQIELGARGPEWTEVLRRRLLALKDYVGQQILRVAVAREKNVLELKFSVPDLNLLTFEEYQR